MRMSTEREGLSRRPVPSDGLQGEHPLDVPAHHYQVPLALHVRQSAQKKPRNPIADLMLPNTGSGVCLRLNVGIEVNSTSVSIQSLRIRIPSNSRLLGNVPLRSRAEQSLRDRHRIRRPALPCGLNWI